MKWIGLHKDTVDAYKEKQTYRGTCTMTIQIIFSLIQ